MRTHAGQAITVKKCNIYVHVCMRLYAYLSLKNWNDRAEKKDRERRRKSCIATERGDTLSSSLSPLHLYRCQCGSDMRSASLCWSACPNNKPPVRSRCRYRCRGRNSTRFTFSMMINVADECDDKKAPKRSWELLKSRREAAERQREREWRRACRVS